MKLSEQLQQNHESGDFGKALEGYVERAKQLENKVDVMTKALMAIRDIDYGGSKHDSAHIAYAILGDT